MNHFETADFYRRMRFAKSLWPNETANDHAKKNWGDILDEFERTVSEYRCNICGGVVRFDGTKPVPGNWGGRT